MPAKLKCETTQRGFTFIEFLDYNGITCSLQKSSVATEDCVWLGCDEIGLKRFTPGIGWEDVPLVDDAPYGITHLANTRMHLSREQVKGMLPYLERFVRTGNLDKPKNT